MNRKIDSYYKQIKEAQEKIDKMRTGCPHKETKEGYFSWRVGCIEKFVLCVECDQPIRPVMENFNEYKYFLI